MVDHGGWGLAVYPNYQLDDGFTITDENGEDSRIRRQLVYLPLLISKEVAHFYTLAGNVGYRRNLMSRGDDINIALGVGRAVPGDGRVLAEVFSERDEFLQNRQNGRSRGLLLQPVAEVMGATGHGVPATYRSGTPSAPRNRRSWSTRSSFGVSIIKLPVGE
jgi:hypothetical protein